ncbi:MAG: hypothetical protein HYU64_12950 [Armatimonadetes bacterium]|nr:hypothetical protein [Armatimonadota bacterium]
MYSLITSVAPHSFSVNGKGQEVPQDPNKELEELRQEIADIRKRLEEPSAESRMRDLAKKGVEGGKSLVEKTKETANKMSEEYSKLVEKHPVLMSTIIATAGVIAGVALENSGALDNVKNKANHILHSSTTKEIAKEAVRIGINAVVTDQVVKYELEKHKA